MANEMALAYIGKMLGQLGSALGGNQQNLVNYGQQAAMSNEQLLADLHQKKYEEEKEKEENKLSWSDSGLDILKKGSKKVFGDKNSDTIDDIFGVGETALRATTGDISGAVSSGAKTISGFGKDSATQAKGGDGATAGVPLNPTANAPRYTQESRVGEDTRPFAGTENEYPYNATPKTLESSFVNPAPITQPQQKSSLFSTIMSDPKVQEGITGIASKLSTPSKPHLSTVGLYPETASNLRSQIMQQENSDRQFQADQAQAQERSAYYKQQQEFDRQKFDYEKAQDTAKANAPNSITTNELLRLEDGSVGTGSISPNGQVNIQPVPGVTLPEKTQNKQFVNLGGVNVPVEALFPQIESWKQAHPEMTDYEIVQNMALENADYMSQYKPQLPYMVNQGDQITAIPRNGQGTPTTIPVPPSPRQQAEDERAEEDQELQRKGVEGQSTKSYNEMVIDRAKTFTTKLKEQRSVQGTPIPGSAKTALATKINALAKKADGGEYLIDDYDISNISDAEGVLSADVTFYAGGEPLPPQRVEVKY